MSLEAVVYKHARNIGLDNRGAFLDDETGEVYFEDPELAKQFTEDTFIAIRRRLGNVAMIDTLYSEIVEILGVNSLLCSKVLYSGSHCGDILGLEVMNSLEKEINFIHKNFDNKLSPVVKVFLSDMCKLIKVSKEQNNPIVFI